MRDITVVVATRNRRPQLLSTLAHHEAPVIVVDNGSTDGGPDAVEPAYPDVEVVRLGHNAGAAAARNAGVKRARSRYVAFADDDSYWAPGALARAVRLLDGYPRVGLLAGRVLVGVEGRLDQVSADMATAPLGRPDGLPGPAVLGFLGCAAIVRVEAYLSVGGFTERLHTYGEEDLLAWDLAATGWGLSYVDALVVHHLPRQRGRSPALRKLLEERNRLLTTWLRRPLAMGAGRGADALRSADGRAALVAALRELPWVLRHRRPVPARIEAALRHLQSG